MSPQSTVHAPTPTRRLPSREAMSHAIKAALTPDVQRYVWRRLRMYGHLQCVEVDELQQYLYIATWKTLESLPGYRLDPTVARRQIYNKLLDLLRNCGRERLGLGLRRRNAHLWRQTLQGLDLDCLGRPHEADTPLERLAWDLGRQRLVAALQKIADGHAGNALQSKLAAARGERLTTLVLRSKRLFTPLVRMAVEEAGSPQEGVRLFYEAVHYFRHCA